MAQERKRKAAGKSGGARRPGAGGAAQSGGKLPANAVHPLTREAWRAWLAEHHQRPAGVWLVSYKKATGLARFDYDAAVEEALCFGWVDSKANKLDDARSMLWFAPRKPKTGWSRPNKLRIEKLSAAGRMTEVGLAKVRAAQVDGSWSSLDAVEALEIPEDLATARKSATRGARIEETVRLAARGERANQWKPPTAPVPPRATKEE